MISRLIDIVLPPRCPFTGEQVDKPGVVTAEAWAKLNFIADPVCDLCGFPFEFETPETSALCAGCLVDQPPFRARAALAYDDASRDFILGFKHGDHTHAVTAMVPWLKAAGRDLWSEADLIMPVPLHRWRILARRYNQSALIGSAVAKAVKIPFVADGLVRSRPTPTQGHLNSAQRRDNVRRAFTINPARAGRIKGRSILLIDDVYTTGATVRECAETLLGGGARAVMVLTLARVVKPQRV